MIIVPGNAQGNVVVGYNEKPKNVPDSALHVIIQHDIFSDFFTLTLSNGHTEELEPEAARTWFKERGAKMDALNAALDQSFNFPRPVHFYICNPKSPGPRLPGYAPKL